MIDVVDSPDFAITAKDVFHTEALRHHAPRPTQISMLAILELVALLFIVPYVLFAILLRKAARMVGTVFEPYVLLAGAWCAAAGLFLLYKQAPDSLAILTLVDVLAESHVLGISMPTVLLLVAGALTILAVAIAAHRHFAARKSNR